MKAKTIPSAWMRRDGRRFDSGPYMSGALEAKIRLEELACRKDRLADLTAGYAGGIYNGPQFVRSFVDDPEHGVPFLGTASMLRADLSDLPLLRKRDALSPKLSFLRIDPGMTLISCSGTIGRMVYARPDMAGMWSNQDILKVVADPARVQPGYLYAFLSGKFGVPLVTSGTYGAIIQHIEPQHIADLPVPRLGDEVEREAHRLVDLAAANRTKAIQLLNASLASVEYLLDTANLCSHLGVSWSSVVASQLQSRCDAYYYSPECEAARRAFDGADVPEHRRLGDIAEVFIPGIFKRRYADDPAFGVPYITGGDVFQLAPTSDRFLMSRVANENLLVIKKGMLLVQEAGQLGGLVGKSVFVGGHLDGYAVSNNMVRVTALDERDAGYLFALLSTTAGVTLVAREAAGSSIPHMDATRIRSLSLPWPDAARRHEISRTVVDAFELRDRAAKAEDEARALVERTVEEAA
jgi:type I restriction enzyme, S subunit